MIIRFTLNGRPVSPDLRPEVMLIDVLRDEFGLLSVKRGCGIGFCGACSTLVDDSLVPTCLIPAFTVRGKTVLTLEGFFAYVEYREIDEKFTEAGYFPCGYCRPGKVLGVYELLKKNPQPEEREILNALAGHHCRCNEYAALVRAVTLVSLKNRKRPA